MKKLTLEVTQQDILEGIRKDAACCPIARAVKRAFPTWQKVEVTDDGIRVLDEFNTRWFTGEIEIATDFMEFFDLGYPVSPFTLEVTFEEAEREPLDWEY